MKTQEIKYLKEYIDTEFPTLRDYDSMTNEDRKLISETLGFDTYKLSCEASIAWQNLIKSIEDSYTNKFSKWLFRIYVKIKGL